MIPKTKTDIIRRTAGQFAAVLSSTIYLSPIWRKTITQDNIGEVVTRWAGIIETEAGGEQVIQLIVDDLMRMEPEFQEAWKLLTNAQKTSCSNALRNILIECRQNSAAID